MLQIPLADLDTDKGKLEEELLRSVVTISNLKFYQDEIEDTDSKSSIEKAISVSIMKLFAVIVFFSFCFFLFTLEGYFRI